MTVFSRTSTPWSTATIRLVDQANIDPGTGLVTDTADVNVWVASADESGVWTADVTPATGTQCFVVTEVPVGPDTQWIVRVVAADGAGPFDPAELDQVTPEPVAAAGPDPAQIETLVQAYLATLGLNQEVLFGVVAVPTALWDPAQDVQPEVLPIPEGLPFFSFTPGVGEGQEGVWTAVSRWSFGGVGEMATLTSAIDDVTFLGRILVAGLNMDTNEQGALRFVDTQDGATFAGRPLALNPAQQAMVAAGIEDISAADIEISQENPEDWTTNPVDVQAALNEIAARVKALEP